MIESCSRCQGRGKILMPIEPSTKHVKSAPCPDCNGTGYATVAIGEEVNVHDLGGRLSPAVVTHIYADGDARVSLDGGKTDVSPVNLITKRRNILIRADDALNKALEKLAGNDSVSAYLLSLAYADAEIRHVDMPEDRLERRGKRGQGRRETIE